MHETAEDLHALQALLDRSLASQYSPNLKEIFPARYALTAADVVALFPDTVVVAFATVTARCEPRVTSVDVLFYRGQFYHPGDRGSLRVVNFCRRPSVSLTYFDADDNAVIVHGRVTLVEQHHADFDAVDRFRQSVGRMSLRDWSPTAFYARVDASKMFGKFGKRGRPGESV